jgi:putative multiple sugar transport system substrate-binding protein
MKRFSAVLAGIAFGAAATFAPSMPGGLGMSPAFAADKGYVGIAMPTKSSARWISDGESMVKQFEEAGYKTDLQYAEDDIPNQLSQDRLCPMRWQMPRQPGSRFLPMTV